MTPCPLDLSYWLKEKPDFSSIDNERHRPSEIADPDIRAFGDWKSNWTRTPSARFPSPQTAETEEFGKASKLLNLCRAPVETPAATTKAQKRQISYAQTVNRFAADAVASCHATYPQKHGETHGIAIVKEVVIMRRVLSLGMQVVQDNTDYKKEQHGQSSHIVFAKRMVHSPIKNTGHEHGRQNQSVSIRKK